MEDCTFGDSKYAVALSKALSRVDHNTAKKISGLIHSYTQKHVAIQDIENRQIAKSIDAMLFALYRRKLEEYIQRLQESQHFEHDWDWLALWVSAEKVLGERHWRKYKRKHKKVT